MTSNEEPEQDRQRRNLPWLLLGSLALLLLLLADLGGWLITRDEARHPGVVAGGKRLLPPRSVTGAAGGPVLQTSEDENSARTAGHELTVATHVVGLLAPGRVRPLVVTVHNTATAAVRLTAAHVTVAQPKDLRCRAAWFSVTGSVPAGTTLPAGGRADVTLRIELRDEPVNQNACQSQQIPFHVTVAGVQAGP